MDNNRMNIMEQAYKEGCYKKALQIADDYLANQNGDDLDALFMKASILSSPIPEYCDYHRALGIALYALNLDLSNIESWLQYGSVCDCCGVYTEAERAYRMVIKMDTSNYFALKCLAALYSHPGVDITIEESILLLENVVSLYPNEWEPRQNLAISYLETGRTDEAKIMLTKAKEMFTVTTPDDQMILDTIKKQLNKISE